MAARGCLRKFVCYSRGMENANTQPGFPHRYRIMFLTSRGLAAQDIHLRLPIKTDKDLEMIQEILDAKSPYPVQNITGWSKYDN